MRFLADHCIPAAVVNTLKEAGHEALRLVEVLPADSPDEQVIKKATERDAILISLNNDFTNIIMYPPRLYQGIIALYLKNHPKILPQLMDRLLAYLATHPEQEHYQGKLLIIEAHRLRIRE